MNFDPVEKMSGTLVYDLDTPDRVNEKKIIKMTELGALTPEKKEELTNRFEKGFWNEWIKKFVHPKVSVSGSAYSSFWATPWYCNLPGGSACKSKVTEYYIEVNDKIREECNKLGVKIPDPPAPTEEFYEGDSNRRNSLWFGGKD